VKLVDLVKRVQDAALAASLFIDADGTLMLSVTTDPPFGSSSGIRWPLLTYEIEGDSTADYVIERYSSSPYLSDARIISELVTASEHPDAIYRRDLLERIAKKDAERKARSERIAKTNAERKARSNAPA
jgi:hypothetical protein